MSQRRPQNLCPQQNWRGDDEIISMETRILPKITPYSTTRSIPQVEIPIRRFEPSSSNKRSSTSSIEPTPKRHRIDMITMSPTPKTEDDDESINTSCNSKGNPRNPAKATSGNNAGVESADEGERESSSETMNTEPDKSSYVHELGTAMFTFRFGGEVLPSSIHQNVICTKIPGFRKYLKSTQPGDVEVAFPAEMADTIGALIEWSYKSRLPEVSPTTTPEESYIRIKLYCLAAELGQVQLMNEAMDFIVGYLRERRPRWDVDWSAYVYQHTDPGSPLRTLFAKWYLHRFDNTNDEGRWTTEVFATALLEQPDLLYDVHALLRTRKLRAKNPKDEIASKYHVTSWSPATSRQGTEDSHPSSTPGVFRCDEMYELRPEDQEAMEAEEQHGYSSDELVFARNKHKSSRVVRRGVTAPV